VDLPPEVIQFVEGHHERLDGSGYPHGLKRAEVSMIARIGAVADMYDALTSERPYRGPEMPQQAMAILRSDAIEKLDPDVLDALDAVMLEWERAGWKGELTGRLPEMPRNMTVGARPPVRAEVGCETWRRQS
jgi:HD-GYP domain-containing protein (c-di-GMP phosphodiesterase class II)